jgi:hypothetical protein
MFTKSDSVQTEVHPVAGNEQFMMREGQDGGGNPPLLWRLGRNVILRR